jgi:capsid protein
VTAEEYFDVIEIVRGMLLTLPPAGRPHQFKPKQPTTNYEMFVNAKLRECGRMLNVPFGKMAGDHSVTTTRPGSWTTAAYWSDRDDRAAGARGEGLRPAVLEVVRLRPVRDLPALAAFKGQWWQLKHCWHYDARPSSDPVKDATGRRGST